MVTIGVYKSLSNSEMYEYICMYNKLYKSSGKCDDKQHYNYNIQAAMVSNTKGFTDKSPMSPGPSATVKIPVQENHSVNILNYWMPKKNCSSQNGSCKKNHKDI